MSDEANKEASSGCGALVAWGSTGRRLLFSPDDLSFPVSLSAHENAPWLRKQWAATKQYWIHRVSNESKLQSLSLPELLEKMEQSVLSRLETKKKASKWNKKKKRISKAAVEHGCVGGANNVVKLTNFIALDQFRDEEDGGEELMKTLVERMFTYGTISSVKLLIDEQPSSSAKVRRTEAVESTVVEDQRVSLLISFQDESAAIAATRINGVEFDERKLICNIAFASSRDKEN